MRGAPIRLTAAGTIISSGDPIRLYGVMIDSGTSAGFVSFRDGTGTSATAILPNVSGAAQQGKMVADIPTNGILFPNGLYVDFLTPAPTSVVCWAEMVANAP